MQIIETQTSDTQRVTTIHHGGNTYRTVDRIDHVGRAIVTTPVRVERLDGLDCETAARTVRYLVGRFGGRLLPCRGFVVEAEIDAVGLGELERAARAHGFGLRIDRSVTPLRISIDAASCPSDATPEARAALIRSRAHEAGCEAAEWLESSALREAAERGSHTSVGRTDDAYWSAHDQMVGWIEDDTIVALRATPSTRAMIRTEVVS
jgi:hypothetical protein